MEPLIKRPMLADSAEIDEINFPCIASPKLDGIRCLKLGGNAVARSLKPMPNAFVRETLARLLPEGIDGEILAGDTFQATTSGLMSREGEPDFTFWAFDIVTKNLERPYVKRLMDLERAVNRVQHKRVRMVPVTLCKTAEDLEAFEEKCLKEGFEGVIVRDPYGPYKNGRSTKRQGWMLKIKRFVDSEALIEGFLEMMHNENEAEISELGYTKRSSAKAGKVPADTLGKFEAKDIHSGIQFRIGTGKGLTLELRKHIWDNRETYLGKIVKYRYQAIGVKEAPRIPVFLGFRDPIDM